MEDLLWLVSFSDEDDRELTTLEIGNALAEGQIAPATLVWRDGMAEWQALSELPELASVISRHQAMVAALSKRQTVIGGFRATALSGEAAAHIPPLPAAPERSRSLNDALGAVRTLESANPDAEPPTLRPVAQPPQAALTAPVNGEPVTVRQDTVRQDALRHDGEKARPRAPHPADNRRDTLRVQLAGPKRVEAPPRETPSATDSAFAGFQTVPVRKRLSSSSGFDIPTPDPGEAEHRLSEPPMERGTTPPGIPVPTRQAGNPLLDFNDLDDFEDTPVSLDSSTLETLDSTDYRSRPRMDAPSSGNFPTQESARPGTAAASGTPRTTLPPRSNGATPGRPRSEPRPPLRTVPPSNPMRWNVDTTGVPLSASNPAPAAQPQASVQRRFLWVMAGTAAAAVLALVFRPEVPASVGDSKTASQVFAAKAVNNDAPSAPAAEKKPATEANTDKPAQNAKNATEIAVNPPAANAPVVGNAKTPAAETRATTPANANAPAKPTTPNSAGRPATAQNIAEKVNIGKPSVAPNFRAQTPSVSVAVTPTKANLAAPAVNKERDTTQTSASVKVVAVNAAPATEFDRGAASSALDGAAGEASACRKEGDPSGVARVSVTFSETGRATMAIVDGPPFAGTATGGCIAETMRKAHVPSYVGDRVTVKKTVVIH